MMKNTICLWYDHDAAEAARFYAQTFPDSTVGAVHRVPSDFPGGKAGDVLTVELHLSMRALLSRRTWLTPKGDATRKLTHHIYATASKQVASRTLKELRCRTPLCSLVMSARP